MEGGSRSRGNPTNVPTVDDTINFYPVTYLTLRNAINRSRYNSTTQIRPHVKYTFEMKLDH